MIQFLSISTNRRKRSSFADLQEVIINVTAADCVKKKKKLNGTNYDLCKYVHFQKKK